MRFSFSWAGILLAVWLPASPGQTLPKDPQPSASGQKDRAIEDADEAKEPKRIFGIIPNYRTFPSLINYIPLTIHEKFAIATQDAFDRGSFVLAAAFAGEGQLTNSNRTFGQGIEGYAHYFATSFADIAIGDYMTEAVFPTLLHQDPRYFRRGTGSTSSRMAYAAGQIFWTHKDRGGSEFNFSEIAGNATVAAISNAYYPDNRTASDAAIRLGVQVGIDMAGNILKEFWPDIYHRISRRHGAAGQR